MRTSAKGRRRIVAIAAGCALAFLIGCEDESVAPEGSKGDLAPVEQPNASPPAEPPVARSSEGTGGVLTVRFEPGERVELRPGTPIYKEPSTGGAPPPFAAYYAQPSHKYSFLSAEDEMMTLASGEDGEVTVPAWYGTDAARGVREAAPIRIDAKPEARLSLFPGSETRMEALDAGGTLYSVLQWEDWFGVPIPPEPWYAEDTVRAPAMLWLHASDVASSGPLTGGLWDEAAGVPSSVVRSFAESALHEEADRTSVERLLGPADVRETSRSLNETGAPLSVAERWRYERENAHFVLDFEEDGTIATWRWTVPLTRAEQLEVSGYTYPTIRNYSFRELPLAPTIEVEKTWRNQGALAYAFLHAATDDALLVRGDDGGFSGMHYDSNLYAIDRRSGDTLWRIDAGYSGFIAMLDEDREHVAVFTPYDPAAKAYRQLVRRVRLTDGETMWSVEHPTEDRFMSMSGAKGVVALYTEPFEEKAGQLTTLDAHTGKPLWEKSYREPYRLLNETGREPYLLVLQGSKLSALDPVTGRVRWTANAKETLSEKEPDWVPDVAPRRHDPFRDDDEGFLWTTLGKELARVDTATGRVEARYPLRKNELVSLLDERQWLVQRSLDAPEWYNGTRFETSLYDAAAAEPVWTIPGRASGAMAQGDRIYLAIDGVPSAVSRADGEILWQTPTTGVGDPDRGFAAIALLGDPLLFAIGEDVVQVDEDDGAVVGRWKDALIGFPDTLVRWAWGGLLNRDGDTVYLGSANGAFSSVPVFGSR